MKPWVNFIGYQIAWLIAVMGASRGFTWPALSACGLFLGAQLAVSRHRARELRVIAAAIGCGLIIDGGLAASGLLHYAAPSLALPPGGAPLWILGIWAAFATTLTRSLHWLQGRPILAACFAAIGAPLAYLGAERGWHAVVFAAPLWRGVAVLGAGWIAAITVLLWLSAPARDSAAYAP
jgi:hypothetical protein